MRCDVIVRASYTAEHKEHNPPMGKRVVPPEARVLLTRVPLTVTNPTSRLAAAAEATSSEPQQRAPQKSAVHSWQKKFSSLTIHNVQQAMGIGVDVRCAQGTRSQQEAVLGNA